MLEFNPISAIAGGLVIGIAATILLGFSGRIAGISGILSGVFTLLPAERNWRLLFLLGLVVGGWLFSAISGSPLMDRTEFPAWKLVLAGLLVGAGTRLGSGCTSGHGVCGISRLSNRSIVATVTFLVTGAVTATIIQLAGAG